MRIIYILEFILITALISLYIFQINSLILESYQTQSYQKKIAELKEQNRVLEIKLTKTNYLEDMASKSKELGLERGGDVHYIQVSQGTVAARPHEKP